MWEVKRDQIRHGVYATESLALEALLKKHQNQSIDWAMQHEGWSVSRCKSHGFDLQLGRTEFGAVNVEVKLETRTDKQEMPGGHIGETHKTRLSICGNEGKDSWGQIIDAIDRIIEPRHPWESRRFEIRDIWQEWHLNDMRAGCEHQRADWDTSAQIEVVEYRLTKSARAIQKAAVVKATDAAMDYKRADLDDTEKALLRIDPYSTDFFPPDAEGPLSGCYEVAKRETKAAGWVKPTESRRGLLCKPCEQCGYKYGSAWLHEPLPVEVLTAVLSWEAFNKLGEYQ